MSEPWKIRAAVPEDESCLIPMWLRAYANSSDVMTRWPLAADKDSRDRVAYWRAHHPIVTSLLRTADVRVLCDPERSTYAGDKRAVIWAWSCTLPGRVFWVSVHRKIAAEDPDLAAEMVRALVGDEMDGEATVEFWQMDLHRLGVKPAGWRQGGAWLRSMLALSKAMNEGDALTAVVGAYVLDPTRPMWRPEAA